MSNRIRLELARSLDLKRGARTKLAQKLGRDKSFITRLINCETTLTDIYKETIYEFVKNEIGLSIEREILFSSELVDNYQKKKPDSYNNPFAKNVRIAIEKQLNFSNFENEKQIIQKYKLIAAGSLSEYKNGISICTGKQLDNLAKTLNVVPQFLQNEVKIPYDYNLKEVIHHIVTNKQTIASLETSLQQMLSVLKAFYPTASNYYVNLNTDLLLYKIIESLKIHYEIATQETIFENAIQLSERIRSGIRNFSSLDADLFETLPGIDIEDTKAKSVLLSKKDQYFLHLSNCENKYIPWLKSRFNIIVDNQDRLALKSIIITGVDETGAELQIYDRYFKYISKYEKWSDQEKESLDLVVNVYNVQNNRKEE